MSKYCKIIQSTPVYEQDLIPTAQYKGTLYIGVVADLEVRVAFHVMR